MTLLVTECVKDAIGLGRGHVNFSPGVDQSKTRWECGLNRRRHFIIVRGRPGSRAKLR
jgi:hypothetical protein